MIGLEGDLSTAIDFAGDCIFYVLFIGWKVLMMIVNNE
jgi:hypothetical protein